MSSARSAQDVLRFWFGTRPYSAGSLQQHQRLWFGDAAAPELTPQADELIRERFGALMLAAERGELDGWESSPRRRLALILLLGQFARSAWRGTARAFVREHAALALTVSGMQFGADAPLDPFERLFFYRPLMYAEALEVQEESVAAARRLLEEAPESLRAPFERTLQQAMLHRDIIARFGRFPQRNALLGRDSGSDEREWLADPAVRLSLPEE
jgi:uncharacterized protein (DUF924 family)